MKKTTLLVVLTIALFISAISFKINTPKKFLPQDLTPQKPATFEDWKKKYPTIKEFVLETSPQNLPANLPHPGITTSEFFSFPEDGWQIGFKPEVIGAKHALHHADVIDLTNPNFFCTNSMPNVLTATGEELAPGFLPLGHGYRITPQAKFTVSLMYHNRGGVPLSNVRTRLTFYYIPKNSVDLTETKPFFFDVVGPCQWGDYFIPAKTKHTKKMEPEYVVQKPGRIVFMGVHMHHYAKSFEFFLNGKPLKKFEIKKSKEGEKLIMPRYAPKYLHVNKGDKLGIRATYENTTDKQIDAMAEALFFLVPE